LPDLLPFARVPTAQLHHLDEELLTTPSQRFQIANMSEQGASSVCLNIPAASGTTSNSHELEEVLPGQRVSVFTCSGKKFFVGVQLATLLHRETFNLYRSMKIKHVQISRATHDQVLYLVKVGAVRPGTHSVTLVDYETCLGFLREITKKRRSEPDIVFPVKRTPDGERSPLKQRRASSAMPLSDMQFHRLSFGESPGDLNMQSRPASAVQLSASWSGVEPGPMIYVRSSEQHIAATQPAAVVGAAPAGDGSRWYYRAQTAAASSMYWVPPPLVGAAPQPQWAGLAAAPADQQPTSLLDRVEALTQQQPPYTDVDLQELASDL
jgi:hypothetical protein